MTTGRIDLPDYRSECEPTILIPRRLVHVRVLKEGESYVAQSLEYDITGSGPTPVEALKRWRVTAMGHACLDKRDGKEPLAEIPCAPLPYWCGIERDDLIGVYLDEVLKAEPVRKDERRLSGVCEAKQDQK